MARPPPRPFLAPPAGVINTFFTDFLAQDRGIGVQGATQLILAFGAGGALGTVGGGWLAQWLYNRWKWTMPLLMGITTTTVRGLQASGR